MNKIFICASFVSLLVVGCKKNIKQANTIPTELISLLDTSDVFNTDLKVFDLPASYFEVLGNMSYKKKKIEVREILPDSISSKLFSLTGVEVEYVSLVPGDTSLLPQPWAAGHIPIANIFLGEFRFKVNDVYYECFIMFENSGRVIDYLCYKVAQEVKAHMVFFSYMQFYSEYGKKFLCVAILDNSRKNLFRQDGEVLKKVVFEINKTGKFILQCNYSTGNG